MNLQPIVPAINGVLESSAAGYRLKPVYEQNPTIIDTIEGKLVHSIASEFITDSRAWGVQLLDRNYDMVSMDDLSAFLKSDLVSEMVYDIGKYDCDNFAMDTWHTVHQWMPTCPFGVVIRNNHAFNCFVRATQEGPEMIFIEPQEDRIMLEPPLDTNEYIKQILI